MLEGWLNNHAYVEQACKLQNSGYDVGPVLLRHLYKYSLYIKIATKDNGSIFPQKFVKLEDFSFLIKVWKFNFCTYMFIIIALITNHFLRFKNKY